MNFGRQPWFDRLSQRAQMWIVFVFCCLAFYTGLQFQIETEALLVREEARGAVLDRAIRQSRLKHFDFGQQLWISDTPSVTNFSEPKVSE